MWPALFLQQLHYWISSKKEYGKIIQGRQWIYNSAKCWSDQLCLSDRQVARIAKKLENMGLIFIEKLSSKKSDRTNWYSINYDRLNDFSEMKAGGKKLNSHLKEKTSTGNHSDSDTMSLPSRHNVQMYKETETTSDIFTKEQENLLDIKIEENISIFQSKNIAMCLLNIWNEEVGIKTDLATMTKKRAQYLLGAYKLKFNSCLEKWRKFCKAIASSDFLINIFHLKYKLSLDWVLKFDNIQRMFEGHFGVEIKETVTSSPHTSDNSEKAHENMKKIGDPVVYSFHEKILKLLGADAYQSWFKDLTIQITEEGQGVIKSPSVFWKSYVLTHFHKEIDILNAKVI